MTVSTDLAEFLPDASGPGGALCYALAIIGAVRPCEVATSWEDWQLAIADVDAPAPFRTQPRRVRSLVERSPAWRRAVMREQIWPIISEARSGRSFTASAVAPAAGLLTMECDFGSGVERTTVSRAPEQQNSTRVAIVNPLRAAPIATHSFN